MCTFLTSRPRLVILAVLVAAILAAPAYTQEGHTPGKIPVVPGQHDAFVLSVGASRLQRPGNDAQWNAENAKDFDAFWKTQEGRLFHKTHPWLFMDETATVDNISRAMDEIEARVQPGDTVLPGFSGHGSDPRDGEFCFCAHDGLIPLSKIHDWVTRLSDKGTRVIFIIEACHSGALLEIKVPNVAFLVSSAASEFSFDGDAFLLKGNTVFYQALFEAFSGKATVNDQGILTVAETIAYLKKRVPQLCAELRGVKQTPDVSYGGLPPETPLASVNNPAPAR